MKFQTQTHRIIGLILMLFIGSLSVAAQDAPLQDLDHYGDKRRHSQIRIRDRHRPIRLRRDAAGS